MALQPLQRKKAMIDALTEHMGNVSEAVKSVGITRKTHYEYLKTDPEYAEAVKEIDESVLDFAECQLRKLMTGVKMADGEGNIYTTAPCKTSIIFFLKTKGKARGYVEVQQQPISLTTEKAYITLPDGSKLEV